MQNLNKNSNLLSTQTNTFIMDKGEKVRLSRRQQECLFFLVRGKTAKEIGRILSLSHRTVEYYFDEIKNKLGCQSRREVIAKMLSDEGIKKYFL